MTKTYEGQLEVDYSRGVIYFHSNKTGTTLLRIGGLKPIQDIMKHTLDLHIDRDTGERFPRKLTDMQG